MSGLSGRPDTMWFPGKFWEANTPAEFWSKWNPEVHYLCFLLMRFIRRKAGTRLVIMPTILAIFIIMGLSHDGFVWLIANRGREDFQYHWTIFFLMNAIVVIVEKSIRVNIPLPRIIKKLATFTWLTILFLLIFIFL